MEKSFFALILATILTAVHAILFAIALYVILFSFDVFYGIMADRAINGKSFSTKKFGRAIMLLLSYCSVNFVISAICFFSNTGQYVDDLMMVTTITCSIFYAQNMFKNMRNVYPESRFIRFMYWLFSFEIITKIPHLKKFTDYEDKEKKEE